MTADSRPDTILFTFPFNIFCPSLSSLCSPITAIILSFPLISYLPIYLSPFVLFALPADNSTSIQENPCPGIFKHTGTKRLPCMASAVIQSGFPDWLYFILSVFLCSSQTRSLPRLLFPGAFSPARYAKMHTQCRVSIWAGYEIFKVRVKGKSLNCDSWKFFRNVTLSLIAGWKG